MLKNVEKSKCKLVISISTNLEDVYEVFTCRMIL